MVTYNSRISIIIHICTSIIFTSEWNKKPLLLTNHTWRSRHQATYGPFKYHVCTYSWKIITPDTYIVKTFLRSKHPYSGPTILVPPFAHCVCWNGQSKRRKQKLLRSPWLFMQPRAPNFNYSIQHNYNCGVWCHTDYQSSWLIANIKLRKLLHHNSKP